jgi:hypothetical protein
MHLSDLLRTAPGRHMPMRHNHFVYWQERSRDPVEWACQSADDQHAHNHGIAEHWLFRHGIHYARKYSVASMYPNGTGYNPWDRTYHAV